MIRFRSKAGADILMLRAHADAVLAALGREAAAQGIFEGEGLGAALRCWAERPSQPSDVSNEDDGSEDPPDLARRAWPLLQLLREAQHCGEAVTWSST